MSLIVEDGSGKEDAESYCTTLFAAEYYASRGIGAVWRTISVTEREQLLRRATDYIELRFGMRFRDSKLICAQALSFPRVGQTAVPVGVQRACAEYALRAAVAPLVADPTVDAAGVQLKSKTEKLGPMEEKTEYADVGRQTFTPYPAADLLLRPFLRAGGLVR